MANSLIKSSFGMFTAFATFPLKRINEELHQENNSLKQELKKYQTPKNSNNSSKPSSSDFPKTQKPESLCESSGKKPGGQPVHEGTTFKMADAPDTIQKHSPNYWICCGEDLRDYPVFIGLRQIINIPPIEPVERITELLSSIFGLSLSTGGVC